MKGLIKAKSKFCVCVFLAILITVVLMQVQVMADDKGLLSFGTTVTGSITESNDSDQYTVILTQPGKLSLRLTSRISRVQLGWLDSEFQELRRNDWIGEGSDSSPCIHSDSINLEAGTYYIRVFKRDNHTGTYDLTATFSAANNNEQEPNNTPEQAQSISTSQNLTGYISHQDNDDYYKISLPQPGKISLRLTSRIDRVQLRWLDNNLQEMRANDWIGQGSDSSPYIHSDSMDLEAGTYYIRVHKRDSHTGIYNLTVSFTAANNNEIEPNNTPGQAQSLSKAQTVSGFISYQDADDYYKINLTQPCKLSLQLTSRIDRVQLRWLNSELQEMRANDWIGSGSDTTPCIHSDSIDLEAGTYYIRVHKRDSNTGTYDLVLYEATVPAPTPTPTPTPTTTPVPTLNPTPTPTPALNNNRVSDWAKEEVAKAEAMGLIPDVLHNADLTQSITRAEFAAVSVKTYEALLDTGAKVFPAITNPFIDCNDVEVLKAYNAGIAIGTSTTTFEPSALLNREQAATMLTRVFKKITVPGWNIQADSTFLLAYSRPALFADDRLISDWAKDSVYFMAANGIILGIGENTFAPRNTTTDEEARGYANATREQALLIAVRMVENL